MHRVDQKHERPAMVSLFTDVKVEWDEVAELLRIGYRLVANQRMLAAMDAAKPEPSHPRIAR